MNMTIPALIALTVFSAAAATPDMTPANGWQEKSAGAWTIDYKGEGYPGLNGKMTVRPESFYRLSWQSCFSAGAEQQMLRLLWNGTRQRHSAIRVTDRMEKRVQYYYSEAETELKFRFYLNPGAPATLEVGNIKLDALTDLTGNLLPGGDFEKEGDLTAFWTPGWGPKEMYASVVPVSDFLSGQKSLKLPPAPGGGRYAVISDYMPAVPGKNVELRFWAKSDREQILTANIDCQPPGKQEGKLLYQSKQFKLENDWREYSVQYRLPDDLALYPSLQWRLARIHLGHEGGEGNIWIDNVEFHQLPEK